MKKAVQSVICTVLIAGGILLFGGSVFAEQSGGSPASTDTSYIKQLYTDVQTLGYGSDTDTPNWGTFWNRIKTSAKWNRLPKTGQTTVYTTGDDGTYQKGSPASPRFTDNGNGTITDNATGLMWVKDATGTGCNSGAADTWANQIAFCEGSTFAGYSDWRMPNIKELLSIVDFSRYNEAIDPIFTHTVPQYYWSSTTYAGGATFAFTVFLDTGEEITNNKTGTPYCVRPVRGGQ